jgi:hypothetical protein
MKYLTYIAISLLLLPILGGCRKEQQGAPIPPAVYLVSNSITGPGSTAITAITNSASGKVSVSPAVSKIYVNVPQEADVTIAYTLTGTAVAGVNYTPPSPMSVTIPAGAWSANISIPVINTPLVGGNKTIIITLASATGKTQLGIGSDGNYKTFTYTLTN